ncbi:MAG: CheR family methyltransferase, partial [Longimicrobiales bacterium]
IRARRARYQPATLKELPDGSFHVVLWRNLVFTYFVENLQAEILDGILERMAPEGVLVIGGHEELPEGEWPLQKAHRSHPHLPERR